MGKPRGRWVAKEKAVRRAMLNVGFRTMKELAQAAAVSAPRLSAVLGGQRVGDVTADKLAGALKVPVARVFVDTSSKGCRAVQGELDLAPAAAPAADVVQTSAPKVA